jgi:hypothetical protein
MKPRCKVRYRKSIIAIALSAMILAPLQMLPGMASAEGSYATLENEHPRLFFTSEDIPQLQSLAQTTHKEIWEPILNFADSKIDTSPPASPTCPDLEFFRGYGNQMIAFAFAYVITEDSAYFELTRRHLLGFTEWDVWGDESDCGERDLGFHHMLLGNTLAYDWLYNDLSEEDRATIGTHLARRAQESYEASSSGTYQWDNWWRRSYMQNHHWINHSALGLAALALEGEDPRTQTWIDQAVDHLSRVQYLLEGLADGSWHEGIPYQSYGLTLSLPFLDNLRRLKGIDLLPHTYLKNYALWQVYNYLPGTSRFVFSFGDFSWSWSNAYAPQNILRFVAREYGDGHAEWGAQEIIQSVGRYANVYNAPWYVLEFLYYDPTIVAQSPEDLPLDHTFTDLEGVVWRTGWGEDDLTFALKTGPYVGRYAFEQFINGAYPFDHPGLDQANNGHDHEDTNTFYLYRGGVDLTSEAIEYGYGETHYHNTLLIDGQGQYEDPNTYNNYDYWDEDPDLFRDADGVLEAVYGTRNFNFLVSDATNRYRLTDPETGKPGQYRVNEYKRYVLFVKPGYLILLDTILADSPHQYEWVAHFDSSASVEGDWIKGEAMEDQVLGIKVLAPTPFTTSTGTDEKTFIHIQPSSDVADTRFLTVLYPTDQDHWGSKPPITLLGLNDQAAGLRVDQDGTAEDHLLKFGQGEGTVGEYTFDGQVASVTKQGDGSLLKIFFAKGSDLADSNGDRTLLHSSNTDVVVEIIFEGNQLAIVGEELAELSIYAPDADTEQVTFNDQPVPAVREGDYVIINRDSSPTFADVPLDHWAYAYIEALYQADYVAGCSTDPLLYCPEDILTRAESAVFVERGIHGAGTLPDQPTQQIFADVPLNEWFAKWATALWDDGYTSGCGSDPLIYCPLLDHTRAEGSVFFLRMMHGADYIPPDPVGLFADVPLEAWYADWWKRPTTSASSPSARRNRSFDSARMTPSIAPWRPI